MGLLTEFDQFRMIWSEDSDGLARQFSPLLAQSTVPAGAVYDVSRDVRGHAANGGSERVCLCVCVCSGRAIAPGRCVGGAA